MSFKKVIIWGASGHALVVEEILRLGGIYKVVGYLDNFYRSRKGTIFNNAPILGGEEELNGLLNADIKNLIVAIGDCRARLKIANYAKNVGFSLISAVHPNSIVSSSVYIGKGVVIVAGAVVNSNTRIGNNVIINTGAIVDHECIIEDGVHIAPGVKIAGKVYIGRATFVGIGASIIDGIKIGCNSIIAAGAVVVRDIPDNVLAVGVPAKPVKSLDAVKKEI